jgi:catechol 2,3-dioxygenase-like lactoylglutathione lyase family enzyme
MISGGNATVYVGDMNRAVRFYVETLGFKLAERHGDYWASIDAGDGFMLGLHPKSEKQPAPGTPGSVQIGFLVQQPIDDVVAVLSNRGVVFDGPVRSDGVKIASFRDPDGTSLYLCEAPTR